MDWAEWIRTGAYLQSYERSFDTLIDNKMTTYKTLQGAVERP